MVPEAMVPVIKIWNQVKVILLCMIIEGKNTRTLTSGMSYPVQTLIDTKNLEVLEDPVDGMDLSEKWGPRWLH